MIDGNGHIPGDVGDYATEAQQVSNRLSDEALEEVYTHVLKYVENEGIGSITSRNELFRGWRGDPLRTIREECGYPDTLALEPQTYRALYDREPIATLVCQILPRESWQVSPDVYEDEDPDNETPFEKRWKEVDRLLHGQSWYRDMEGSQIWEHLRRADELSGIGSFGVLLLGFNDGKRLDEPVAGALGPGTQFDPGGSPLSQVERKQRSETGEQVDAHKVGNLVEPNTMTQGGLSEWRFDSNPLGTDAQYVGVQLSHDVIPPKDPGQQLDLLFLRAFDESLVQCVQYEADLRNPRFGLPVMYRITLNDPRELHSGIGLPLATVRVHWSRVIHLADNLGSSEIFGVPRMRPVFNRLIDLAKVYGSSAQGYWNGAFMGISFETHPQLGGDVKIDVKQMRAQTRDYLKGLSRMINSVGMTAKPLAPQVSDPTAQIKALLECIAMTLRVPMRVFMGSERGELASSQDMQAHNGRLAFRQNQYLTPRVIIPFVDRLIAVGVLPEPNSKTPVGNRRRQRQLTTNAAAWWWDKYMTFLTSDKTKAFKVYNKRVTYKTDEKDEGKKVTVLELPGEIITNAAAYYPQPEAYGADLVINAYDPSTTTITSDPDDPTAGGDVGQTLSDDEGQGPDRQSSVSSDDEDAPSLPGYVVSWPDLESLTDADKAGIAQQLSAAIASYVQSGAESLIPPALFISEVLKFDEETANTIIEAAMQALEDPSDRLTPNPLDQEQREQESHDLDQQGQEQGQQQDAESHDQNLQQSAEMHEKQINEEPDEETDDVGPLSSGGGGKQQTGA